MATLTANTTITLPAGQVLLFGVGGSATALIDGATYVLGKADASFGPYTSSKSVVIQNVSGTIQYGIDADSDLSNVVRWSPISGQIESPATLAALRNFAVKPSGAAMFILPGRQFAGSGNIKDLSGNSADAVLGAGLTDAQAWASNGYFSAVAGTNSMPAVPLAKSACDIGSESIIFATVMNMAAPGASQAAFGNGSATAGAYGFYLSVRATTGKIRPVINVPSGVVSGLADSTAAFADGADHHVLVAFDYVTGEVKLFRDGALSDSYAANSYSRAASAVPIGFFGLIGGNSTASPGYAGKAYGAQLYRKAGVGLPSNLAQIAAKLAAAPASYLTDADLDW